MFDIEEFTAIINPPDACILAVGAIKAVPVVKDGNVVAGNVMRVTELRPSCCGWCYRREVFRNAKRLFGKPGFVVGSMIYISISFPTKALRQRRILFFVA